MSLTNTTEAPPPGAPEQPSVHPVDEVLPAFVLLRQDTSLVAAAEGWDPDRWQEVVDETAKALAWTSPQVSGAHDPARGTSWPV